MPSKIITKLILREVALPFFFSLGALSLLFLVGKLFTHLEPLLAAGIGLREFLKLNLLMLPIFLYILIPICTMLGILIAFIRLSRDSEMIALFACGIGPSKILFPVVLVSTTAFLVGLVVSGIIVPEAKRQTSRFMDNITEKALMRGLPEKQFFTPLKGLTFFVDKALQGSRKYEGIFIKDARGEAMSYSILAKRGTLSSDVGSGKMALELYDGKLIRVDKNFELADTITFEKYILSLTAPQETGRKRRGQMTTLELYRAANSPDVSAKYRTKYLIEFHKRIGVPFGALLLGLLAAPFGIFFGRSGISAGVCAGLSAFLAYYLAILFGTTLANKNVLTPWLGVWLPNMFFLVIALYSCSLLYKRGPIFR
ncbi:MAG: LPS export ABC transporter permease LptF [Thermodesulfobacteria bacterium]|nr:LPS export ABC transporter permease LptF [Thermodesulfobacteriota bacterium]